MGPSIIKLVNLKEQGRQRGKKGVGERRREGGLELELSGRALVCQVSGPGFNHHCSPFQRKKEKKIEPLLTFY